jgi:hypothetical protein
MNQRSVSCSRCDWCFRASLLTVLVEIIMWGDFSYSSSCVERFLLSTRINIDLDPNYLQLMNGSNFLLFRFGVVKGGDLVSAGWILQQQFVGFCILRLLWHLEFGYIFSSFLAIEGPCIAITNNMCPLGQGFNSLAWCCFRFKALLNKSLSLHVASPIF